SLSPESGAKAGMTHKVGCQFRHPIILAFGPAILDCSILPFDKADFAETLAERSQIQRKGIERTKSQKSDYWHHRLLRPRRKRPRRRAAKQRDELAAFHCSVPLVLPNKRNSTQGTAGLRDFSRAYARFGARAASTKAQVVCFSLFATDLYR